MSSPNNKTRPVRHTGPIQQVKTVADMNIFADQSTDYGEFMGSIGAQMHALRGYLLITVGLHGNALHPPDIDRMLVWQDMLSRIEREADVMLERYLEATEQVDRQETRELPTQDSRGQHEE